MLFGPQQLQGAPVRCDDISLLVPHQLQLQQAPFMVRIEEYFQPGAIAIANPALNVERLLADKRWPVVASNIEFDHGSVTSYSTNSRILYVGQQLSTIGGPQLICNRPDDLPFDCRQGTHGHGFKITSRLRLIRQSLALKNDLEADSTGGALTDQFFGDPQEFRLCASPVAPVVAELLTWHIRARVCNREPVNACKRTTFCSGLIEESQGIVAIEKEQRVRRQRLWPISSAKNFQRSSWIHSLGPRMIGTMML